MKNIKYLNLFLLILLFFTYSNYASASREIDCTSDFSSCSELKGYWSLNDGPQGISQALNINQETNWDTTNVYGPTVILDGTTYKMWYSGQDATNWRILYSTSTNGTTWTTPVQALNMNQETNWDTNGAISPTVIKDGSTYKMWYAGSDGSNWRILYATSSDGTDWNTPVQALNYNQETNWDTSYIDTPTVIKDGSTYKMWYTGFDGSLYRILYTTSTDGITWNTPVQALDYNQEGNWDTAGTHAPTVIKDGATYKMWVSAVDGVHWRILYSTSSDGITWSTPVQAMDYNQEGVWDTVHGISPSVMPDGDGYKMWYSAHDGSNYRIVYTKTNFIDSTGTNDGMGWANLPVYTSSGKISGAFDFNGTDDFISIPDNASLTPGTQMTLSAWVNPDIISSDLTDTVLAKWTGADCLNGEYALGLLDAGNLTLGWHTTGGTVWGTSACNYASSTGTISTGEWSHIAAVRNGTNVTFYINGAASGASNPVDGNPIASSTEDLFVGAEDSYANRYFDGDIDEISIWNTALDSTEINQLYNLGASPISTSTLFTGNGTTDFDNVSDMTSISSMKLATSTGSITWSGNVNAANDDYDTYVSIGTGYVSLDATNLDASIDSAATVSINVDGCDTYDIYYAASYYTSLADIKTNGQACNGTTTPACTSISCTNNVLTFTVPNFDGYGGEGFSSDELSTTVGISGSSPVITTTSSDGGSAGGAGAGDTSGNPTNVGSDVTFTATAKDINGDQYYLAVCKTDAVTTGAPPTCDGGNWGISSATNSNSEASQTYTTLVGDAESNAWYAFVCDSSSCYPANAAGDQGKALGTVTFSAGDRPEDESAITIGSTENRFDMGGDGCVGTGTCLDMSSAQDGQDMATLLGAETISGVSMEVRANVVYIYADSIGATGNSISLSEAGDSGGQITLSGASLAGGSDDNMSPFKVNHAGTFGTATVADDGITEYDTEDTDIEPGETLKFTLASADIADADTDTAQDLMTMHICTEATTSFDYSANTCTGGTLICSSSAVNPTTTDATCTGGASLISVPTAHGSYNFDVYVEDNHNFPATGTVSQSYTVIDVAPTLIAYTATDEPIPLAGGSDTVVFSVSLTDINGDNDVSNVKGVFFDPSPVTHDCTADENNCYIHSSCTLSEISTPGAGKTSLGIDKDLVADCSFTVWFNANASDWDVQIEVTDDAVNTEFADAGASLTNPSLQGIDITQASIAFGTVAIGGTSSGAETSMGNVGNQVLDVYIDGDNMCTDFPTCSGSTIAVGQQKWHHNASTFDWDASAGAGPYAMVDTASSTGDATGCMNRDIAIRNDHTLTTTNESIYWKMRIPASQAVGTYTGANTFQSTSSATCSTGQSY